MQNKLKNKQILFQMINSYCGLQNEEGDRIANLVAGLSPGPPENLSLRANLALCNKALCTK